jgi:hypothetical protein
MPKNPVKPYLVCPFTGSEIIIESRPIGSLGRDIHRARAQFWVTKWYGDRDELLHDVSTRGGVEPARPERPVVREREAPPSSPARGLGEPLGDSAAERVDVIARRLAAGGK